MTVRGAQILHVELLTYREVADMLRVSVRTVERLVADQQLTCVRPTPSTPRIHSDDLRAYVQARRKEAAPAGSASSTPGPIRRTTSARRSSSFLDSIAAVER